MPPVVERLPIPRLGCGEGPHWSASAQSLYLISIPQKTLYRYHPATDTAYAVTLDLPSLGFVTPVAGTTDNFLVAAGQTLWLVQWDGVSDKPTSIEELHTLDNEPEGYRINDGKVDPAGRAWFGTVRQADPFNGRDGGFYSYSPGSGSRKHLSQIGISNGLTWSGNVMYYIDSLTCRVDALDFSTSGIIENRRVVFDFKKNDLACYPDGMTVDTEGKLWVACYSGSRVIQVDPEAGKLLEEVNIPTKNVTSVAWGGADLSELYVTTANEVGDPSSGLTYRVTGLPYKGLPMHDFKL